MRLGLPSLPVLALFVAAFASGCGGNQYVYIADFMTTRPTEDSDKEGIWHDIERGTPGRPDPIPVRGVRYVIGVVDAKAEAQDGARAMKTILEKRYSDTHGCTTLWGKADFDDETERLRIVVDRKGYQTMVRDFRKADLADASMTTVVAPPKGQPFPDEPSSSKDARETQRLKDERDARAAEREGA